MDPNAFFNEIENDVDISVEDLIMTLADRLKAVENKGLKYESKENPLPKRFCANPQCGAELIHEHTSRKLCYSCSKERHLDRCRQNSRKAFLRKKGTIN